MGEGNILLEDLGFDLTVSGAVTSVAVVIMEGMNSETRVSFQGEVGVQLGATERVISVTRLEEADVTVGETAVRLLLLEMLGKEIGG